MTAEFDQAMAEIETGFWACLNDTQANATTEAEADDELDQAELAVCLEAYKDAEETEEDTEEADDTEEETALAKQPPRHRGGLAKLAKLF